LFPGHDERIESSFVKQRIKARMRRPLPIALIRGALDDYRISRHRLSPELPAIVVRAENLNPKIDE
jgi:hypothetical protein